nr:FtsX-like permease family protein [Spirochaeta sp.]
VQEIAGATARLVAGATPPRGGEAAAGAAAPSPAPTQTYYAFERYGGACSIREFDIEDRLVLAGIGGSGRGQSDTIPGSRGGLSIAIPGTDDTADGSARVLQVRPWQDFARAAVSAVEGDTYSFTVMVVVMYLLIVLGILNSMSMSVHERTREIGTIRAIGIRRRQLLALFALESVWQALIAAAIALVITTPVALWLANTGVDITSSMPDTMPVPFGERFRGVFAPWQYLFTLASGILTALAGAILPAGRAGKITVAEAMRTVG